jgi:pyocin large subunit-like protein
MLKRNLLFVFVGLFALACNQTTTTQQSTDLQANLISELVAEPMSFENQEVSFEGTITHICQHSGDKMRVNQVSDADYSILVMLEEFKPQFNPSFEGKKVKCTGILKTEVVNMDQIAETHDHDHGEEGHECASTTEAVNKLKEKGVTPDIRTYIVMTGFEIVDESDITVEQTENNEAVIEVANTK